MKFILTILAIYIFNTLLYITYLSAETKVISKDKIYIKTTNHVHPHANSQLNDSKPQVNLIRDLPRLDIP
jgi:hypothetical protein